MVSVQNLGRVLDEHPFFQGIERELHALLVGCAANERFEAGAFLFREGQPADRFFLIRAGTVNVEIDRPGQPPIVIETVLDGEVLGWSWMVEPHRYAFAAKAQTPVRALSFDARCLTRKMEADPALGYAVLRRFVPVMAHRLASARLQMLDLYAPPAQAPAKPKGVTVAAAVPQSKGRNRSAVAALDQPAKAKAKLKLAKPKKDGKKAEKKAEKKASRKKAG